MTTEISVDTVVTAAIVAGFGSTAFVFRLQREVDMEEDREHTWIPWADRLLIAAVLIALGVLVVLFVFEAEAWLVLVSRSAMASSAMLLVGYIFAALAHYRLLLASGRQCKRVNPEPAEARILYLTSLLAAVAFLVAVFVGRDQL